MNLFFDYLIIGVLSSIVLALPGNYLVLRGNSLTTFALSHSMLIGIVISFIIVDDLNSPLLIIGAAISGVTIVWIVEFLARSRYINHDASLGIVYLSFFAIGILLVTRYTSNTLLSVDSILLGSIALIPFERFEINGMDLGPMLVWYLLVVLVLNILFLILFYKEIKISVFDPEFAKLQGFRPNLLHLAYMTIVSLTIVIVFRVAGIIIVVALATIPAATSRLLTNRYHIMIWITVLLAAFSGFLGVWISWELGDIEVASVISTVSGVIFFLVLFLKSFKVNGSSITEQGVQI